MAPVQNQHVGVFTTFDQNSAMWVAVGVKVASTNRCFRAEAGCSSTGLWSEGVSSGHNPGSEFSVTAQSLV